VHGVFTRIRSRITLVASSGGARWLAIYGVGAEAIVDGHSDGSNPIAATQGNEKTLRVSASIFNLASDTATAGWISIGGWLSGGCLTLRLPVLDTTHLGGSAAFARFSGRDETQDPLRTHSTIKMTLQFERKYSSKGSGAPCHVSFVFSSGSYGIILVELQIDPQLESTIRPKARGLHSIWNAILRITFCMWFHLQDSASTIEDLQEKNSRTLGNCSRRFQDYSRISWSTFQPRDASNILEDFRLVVLKDAWGLLAKAVKTTRIYPTRLQILGGLSYGPPWAHYLSGYQDRLLGGPLGLLDLGCTAPVGVKHKNLGGEVLG
jgi:hypothetical protein